MFKIRKLIGEDFSRISFIDKDFGIKYFGIVGYAVDHKSLENRLNELKDPAVCSCGAYSEGSDGLAFVQQYEGFKQYYCGHNGWD